MYINYILGGVMENMFFEIIKILVSLFVGILPFIATILTIRYYVYRDEKNKKAEKNREEKRFLREKLEIIVEEIINCNLEAKTYEKIKKTDEIDNVSKKYKKAFFLSQMYFPELYKIVCSYYLSLGDKRAVMDENNEKCSTVFSREEEYSKFLKQVEVEIEKINKM